MNRIILGVMLLGGVLGVSFGQVLLEGVHFSGYTSPVRAHINTPVLIKFPGEKTGSGFYIATSNYLVLATARHVLFDQAGKLRSTNMVLVSHSDLTNLSHCIVNVDLDSLMKSRHIRAHPRHDVAIVRIGWLTNEGEKSKLTYFTTNGVEAQYVNGGKPRPVTMNALRPFADVKVGDDAYVFGYPSSIGLRASPKFDYSKPLLRKGIIAGVYQDQQTIIVDSSVFFGNSGGPVLEVEQVSFGEYKFQIIGVVTELIPFVENWENKAFGYVNQNVSNSGYCVVEPIDFILELLRD